MEKLKNLALATALGLSLLALLMQNGDSKLSGSTSDDWNVGGNLSVTGTSSLTGALTQTGSLTVSGETKVQGFTQSGGVNATSTTAASETLLEADLLASNVFEVSGQDDGMTLVLPATSTMTTLLSSAGDMREWWIEFATTTTATLTIAAGTGIDLVAVTANDDVIDNGEFARLSCYRQTNTDVTCLISELLAAD